MTIDMNIKTNFDKNELMDLVTRDFSIAYNQFVDEANPHIPEFNAEWYSMHPELKDVGMEPGTKVYCEYGEFFANKENEICAKINEQRNGQTAVLLQCVSIKGEMYVIGRLTFAKNKFIFFGK